MATYSFAIDARVDSGANDGTTITNVARVTPLGGAAVELAAPATTTVQSPAPPLLLHQAGHAHVGQDRRSGHVYR